MTTPNATTPGATAWALIDREKQRDRFVRRVCVTAWAVTFGMIVLFAVGVAIQVAPFIKAANTGELPWATVFGMAMPLIGSLWTLTLLIATLSTVGVFLRFRTASLTEIQLRLAALEEMLTKPEGLK